MFYNDVPTTCGGNPGPLIETVKKEIKKSDERSADLERLNKILEDHPDFGEFIDILRRLPQLYN